MSLYQQEKRSHIIQKFIDFDKYDKKFYDNLYLDDFKIVIKMPIIIEKNREFQDDIKIEEFNLIKYTYLLAYD